MRIGFVSTYPPIECGIATYTQYLTDALRRKHQDCYVVSHLGGTGPQVIPAFDYEDGDLADRAFSVLTRFTPDLVHIQHEFGLFGKNFGVAVVPLILHLRLSGLPVVTTLHTVYDVIPEKPRIVLDSILLHSHRVIVHEPYQRESLARVYPAEWMEKVCVIPHGARIVEPIPGAKEKLNLPADKKVLLLVGYFRPSKNFELIIDIFPEIRRRYRDVILVIAGKTRGREYLDYRNSLLERIRNSPERDAIYFIRGQLPQETFDTVVSAADVVALPYKISSQSGILAHALAFGRPVVVSDTPAMEQAMGRSGAGFVCSTAEDFAGAVVRLLSEPKLWEALSKNARRYVRDVVSWDLVADRHMAVYEKLLDIPPIETHVICVD